MNVLPRALLALSLSAIASTAHADQITILACLNPSSGTAWESKVDLTRRTVDSFPADIGDRYITWTDAQRGQIYEFDRASGDLTMRGPSSTGGYFLYYRCHERR